MTPCDGLGFFSFVLDDLSCLDIKHVLKNHSTYLVTGLFGTALTCAGVYVAVQGIAREYQEVRTPTKVKYYGPPERGQIRRKVNYEYVEMPMTACKLAQVCAGVAFLFVGINLTYASYHCSS